jgi:hypothetical protein
MRSGEVRECRPAVDDELLGSASKREAQPQGARSFCPGDVIHPEKLVRMDVERLEHDIARSPSGLSTARQS